VPCLSSTSTSGPFRVYIAGIASFPGVDFEGILSEFAVLIEEPLNVTATNVNLFLLIKSQKQLVTHRQTRSRALMDPVSAEYRDRRRSFGRGGAGNIRT
jgi:hypothetical protein